MKETFEKRYSSEENAKIKKHLDEFIEQSTGDELRDELHVNNVNYQAIKDYMIDGKYRGYEVIKTNARCRRLVKN